MPDETLSPVSRTAVGVARIRAAESRRPDRLFDDPYAEALVAGLAEAAGAVGSPSANDAFRTALIAHVVIRTVFYDAYLRRASEAGARQVVLLGAGLDTRAWRLSWPADVTLFELDLPAVLAAKDAVLAPYEGGLRCQRVAVPVDLREDWPAALAKAGHRSELPTAWLAEGLLIYLEPADAERLLDHVDRLSAAGSRLACELGDAARARAAEIQAEGSVAALWRGGVTDPAAWLHGRGWSTSRHLLAELAASYGRALQTPSDASFVEAAR